MCLGLVHGAIHLTWGVPRSGLYVMCVMPRSGLRYDVSVWHSQLAYVFGQSWLGCLG
ncbi:hypothetical protein Lalb_Chr02g0152601 [Lupinus albus]|uniref:Uncharacterized protein n=1 Tax=Lupinus albus TaxID=3870 RepID=A0A6A4QY89_LUPAL|nr:hypothetical protein Lalb_Chr02g0152601 [Lupinus albus]